MRKTTRTLLAGMILGLSLLTVSANAQAAEKSMQGGANPTEKVEIAKENTTTKKSALDGKTVTSETLKKQISAKKEQVTNQIKTNQYNSYFLSLTRPSFGETVYKGNSVYVSFNIRNTWKNYYTKPVIGIFNSNNACIYTYLPSGRVAVDSYSYTYTGNLSFNTSSVADGVYKVYVFAAPCTSSGTLLSNWNNFDCPADSTSFYIKSKNTTYSITNASASLSATSYVYTGTSKNPSVSVKYGSRWLVNGTDYTVSYYNNVNVGKAYVQIKGRGNYTGTITKYYTIYPQGTTLYSATSRSRGIMNTSWRTVTAQTSGYQIQLSRYSSFSSSQYAYLYNNRLCNANVKGLVSRAYYYVRIRTFKTVNGTKYCSSWSNVKRVKIK